MVLLAVIGLLGGILNGLSSVGGSLLASFGLVALPPLVTGQMFPMVMVGTFSAGVSLVSAASSFLAYKKRYHVALKNVMEIGVPAALGSVLGTRLAFLISNRMLMLVLTSAMVLALWVFFRPVDRPGPRRSSPVALTFASGFGIGMLGGMLGVGAGFLFLPVSVGILGLSVRTGVINSLAGGFIISLVGLLTRSTSLVVSWPDMAAVMIGGVVGSRLGVAINGLISERQLKGVSGGVLLLITLDMGCRTALTWMH